MNRSTEIRHCVVFVDADNTLWDTNCVYADAQLNLLADVERASGQKADARDRLGWLRQIDQTVAERHHAGLRYPPRLLAKAVALALAGKEISAAARLAWSGGVNQTKLDEDTARKIELTFFEKLRARPALRDGVSEGLRALHNGGCAVIVLTEGHRQKVLSLIRHYDLDKLITRVIEAKKGQRIFARVVALTGRTTKAFMIGDQLDRDIAPAKAAGLITIYFPGGFQPKWQPGERDVQPHYKVRDFNQAAAIILRNEMQIVAGTASA